MTLRDYQPLAMRTCSAQSQARMALNAALGLMGETGELADHLKKHLFQGHAFDRAYMAEELGDVLWYIALGYTAANAYMPDTPCGHALSACGGLPAEGPSVPDMPAALMAVHRAVCAYCTEVMHGEQERSACERALACLLDALAHFAAMLHTTLEDAAAQNVAKLRARYPEGFDSARSIHRA